MCAFAGFACHSTDIQRSRNVFVFCTDIEVKFLKMFSSLVLLHSPAHLKALNAEET